MLAALFGKRLSPKEQIQEWTRSMRKEMRSMDREIRAIQREEETAARELKALAKKQGSAKAMHTLAMSIQRARRAQEQMLEAKTHINSSMLALKAHGANVAVAQHMGKSAQVMSAMNRLLSVPRISQTMQALAREMAKSGIIEEMVQDSFEALDPEGLDEEADQEVAAVLFELTEGQFGAKVGAMQNKKAEEAEEAPAQKIDEEKAVDDLLAQFDKI